MTFVIVARWKAAPGAADEIVDILRRLVAETRKEPGSLLFVAHRSLDAPDEFAIYEQYTSEQAFHEHRQTPHFRELVLERAVPRLAEREVRSFTIVA